MKVELEVRKILWKKVRSAGKAGVINVPKNWIGRNILLYYYPEGDSDVPNTKD